MVIDFDNDERNTACKKCGSNFTYVRLKDRTRVCRSCMHIEKLEDEVDGS